MKSAKTILAFVNAKINEYSSAIKGFITIDDKKWVDLGLPSGRLWATENEPGYHQYDEAVKTFGKQLPSVEAWEELFDHCSRKWNWNKRRKGYILTGPNGNTLFLPAYGGQDWDFETKKPNGRSDYVGLFGHYWSSAPYGTVCARYANICSEYADTQDYHRRLYGFSIRLARESR